MASPLSLLWRLLLALSLIANPLLGQAAPPDAVKPPCPMMAAMADTPHQGMKHHAVAPGSAQAADDGCAHCPPQRDCGMKCAHSACMTPCVPFVMSRQAAVPPSLEPARLAVTFDAPLATGPVDSPGLRPPIA